MDKIKSLGKTGSLALGLIVGVLMTLSTTFLISRRARRDTSSKSARLHSSEIAVNKIVNGVEGIIGNTPMIKIRSLSEATGCEILAKAEFLNPGGSPKDRVALSMIQMAEEQGLIRPNTGCVIFEGTSGSTGISIAMIARAKGYSAWIVMPDDQAQEKYQLLEKLGAHVEKTRPASIVDENQYVNLARRQASEFNSGEESNADHNSDGVKRRGFFANQFENLSNFQAHCNGTGPEIYKQTDGKINAFVAGAGTGGTIGGVSSYLKPLIPELKAEGSRKRHQVDTVIEGVGLNRLTKNFDLAREFIDDAIKVTDREAVEMARYLVREEGLFIGSSSAMNCVGAVRVARMLGPGHRIVTILCDSGQRHLTKFWNDDYLIKHNILQQQTPPIDVLSGSERNDSSNDLSRIM
ncbi:8488_t:CDS:2 [Ambispora gerdemannii]|uniref:cysteine synthase n=1 Tax=Ambispora gerdemannii TaxID=144530 RepID=A0A9N9GEV2_9GLOM|nr:8488_t:CDS:2 [Ambispora gerdemannii]